MKSNTATSASSTPRWIKLTVYVIAALVVVAFASGMVFFR